MSVRQWPAFDDSRDALACLKQHYKRVVLTNTDSVGFSGSNARPGVHFDGDYTAEDVGSYKPSDRNFDCMLETLARQCNAKDDIVHTAESMFHEHGPANRHGLSNCWIYRRHEREGFEATMDPGETPSCIFCFNSMAELAAALKVELSGK